MDLTHMLYDVKSFYARVLGAQLERLSSSSLDQAAQFLGIKRTKKWNLFGFHLWKESDESLRHRIYIHLYSNTTDHQTLRSVDD